VGADRGFRSNTSAIGEETPVPTERDCRCVQTGVMGERGQGFLGAIRV